MALSLNQFAPNEPVAGLYVYQANLPQLHNVIVSASQATVIRAGSIVLLDGSSTNVDAPVIVDYDLGAGKSGTPFGIVTYTPVKNSFVAGERVAVARENDIVWLPAGNAIVEGATLSLEQDTDADGNNIYTVVTLDTEAGTELPIIGTALTPASAADDMVQVELHFGWFVPAE